MKTEIEINLEVDGSMYWALAYVKASGQWSDTIIDNIYLLEAAICSYDEHDLLIWDAVEPDQELTNKLIEKASQEFYASIERKNFTEWD